MKNYKKYYFIALDTDSYQMDDDVIPINLKWEMSPKEMIKTVKKGLKDCKDEDIIIGHSLGATMALFGATKGKLKLYSPSPAFKEALGMVDGNERFKDLSLKMAKLRPTVYVGDGEVPVMKKTARMIKTPNILKGYNHAQIINHSGKIKV